MSSVLKALKRLENERTSRQPDAYRVNQELLNGAAKGRRWPVTLLVLAAVFGCGAGASWLLTGHFPAATPQKTSAPQPPAVRNTSAETAPPPAAPRPPVPVVIEAPPVPPSSPAPSETVPVTPRPAARRADSGAPRPAAKPERQLQPPTAAVPPQFPPAEPHPLLRVNGIAYQEGATENVAVVNGQTVSAGSVVDGARVEEIRRDRVRFSRNGEKIEVLLGKSEER